MSLDDESDGQLIRRYSAGRDERAFAKLVERRGALVAGVCARMLRNRADAEDAFQAVFMVLARRAAALRRDDSLAGWLQAVAVRVCLNERNTARRRERREQEAAQVTRESTSPDDLQELKQVIDEELAALPRRLREVLVLCDLEGQTRDEVARALSLPVGTVSSRLARGRATMRKRLVRQGLAVAVGGVAMNLAKFGQTAPAVTAGLVETTVQNAHIFLFGTAAAKAALGTKITSLAEGALYAMILNRWKVSAFLFLFLAITLFGGAVASGVLPGLTGTASAATIFYDDFEDGSATDGSPATWTAIPNWPFTTLNVSGGDLRVGVSAADRSGVAGVQALSLVDSSIRAQLRAEGQSDQGFGVFLRGDFVSNIAHSFEVGADGSLWFGITGSVQRVAESDLRPTEEDVILQLDAIGNTITAWAWRAGEPMPRTPTYTRVTNQLPSGVPGIYTSAATVPQGNSGTAILRYVHVASVSIPEPLGASLAAAGGAIFASGLFFARRCVWLAL